VSVSTAEPLTEEEQKEKQELSPLGFSNWNKRDFQLFCKGTELNGRDDYEAIAREVLGKTVEEVKEYATVFWARSHELEGEDCFPWTSFR
jgi:SWI/SNF-related matrix-associated actin-dependent regulator of chromatin subfamily A member 5